MKHLITISLLLVLAACSGPKPDKVIGHWQVMTTSSDKSTRLCYTGSNPSKKVTKREQPYLMATRRASGKIEISASSGYEYKAHSKVELVIDGTVHKLTPKGAVAWAKTDEEDKAIITALKSAKKIEVRGIGKNGERTTDRYSADGFANALVRVRRLCP